MHPPLSNSVAKARLFVLTLHKIIIADTTSRPEPNTPNFNTRAQASRTQIQKL